MKTLLRLVLAVLLAATAIGASAQRTFEPGELESLLAPIALYPDTLLSQVLDASQHPDDVLAAAAWARANPQLSGDAALATVQGTSWAPSVKALSAYPEVLARMAESPQWLRDLGEAFVSQQAQVMDTVQGLRRRAQSAGNLPNSDQYRVYEQGETIYVEPRSQIVYVRYYDPYIVYGPWWWPYYRPVYWSAWAPRPVFVTHGFFYARPMWPQKHVLVVNRPVHTSPHVVVSQGRWQPRKQVAVSRPYVRVPESQRRPIVQQHMPAASGFSGQKREFVRQQQPHAQKPMQKQWGNSIGERGHSFQQRGNAGRGGGQRGQRG